MASSLPIVVIGGGTAGCTVVSQLASLTERKIVLIEPGDMSSHDDESHFFDVLADESLIASSENGCLQARVLGGGSAVNGMLLTGDEPEHLHGLTRMAASKDIGAVGEALLRSGGRFSRLWWNGGRWNPGRAVWHLKEEGRILIQQDHAVSIEQEDGTVRGVHRANGFIASDAVVMCAGAISTPKILLASGMSTLNSNIGHGLQNHPTLSATFPLRRMNQSVFDVGVIHEWTIESGAQFLDIAYERVSKTDSEHGLLTVSLMNPSSRGAISLNTSGDVEIDFALLSTDDDVMNMEAGLRHLMQLLQNSSFQNIADPEGIMIGGQFIATLEAMTPLQLRSWMKQAIHMVSHPTSSCCAAVESDGRLKGFSGCWVADASVLPHVPHCTPAAPVTIEALRISRAMGEYIS